MTGYPAGATDVRVVAWIAFAAFLIATVFCGHRFLHFARSTAAPMTPNLVAFAEIDAYISLAFCGASLVAAIVALICALLLGRRKIAQGFELLASDDRTAG